MTIPPVIERHPDLDTWVRVDERETVTVFSGKVELGQGIRSALARIGAEELDLPLARVRVETADTAHGLDEGVTSGSRSLEDSGAALRVAAAEALSVLLEDASMRLGDPLCSLTWKDGAITGPSGVTTYWELRGGRRFDRRIEGRVNPKPPARHRVVGRQLPRVDLPEIVDGTAIYVQDLAPVGLLYGRIVRPPHSDARLLSFAEPSLAEGVRLVRDGSFLGVVADREEDAAAAATRVAGAARWSNERPALPTGRLDEWLLAQARRSFPVIEGTAVDAPVPPPLASDGVARTVRRRYSKSFTMHASIGPAAAVAQAGHDGSLTVWCASQGVYALRAALASALGLDEASIRVVHVIGPGCYGHNGADDVALDAALLARAVPGRPVRVQWSREDEHRWEPYGPAAVIEMEAGLDAGGQIVDWTHETYANTHSGRPTPGPASNLVAAWHFETPLPRPRQTPRLAYHAGIHRNADPLYETPNRRIVKHLVEAAPLRTSALRSLGGYANVFAIESFVDELAEEAGVDAVDFRLRHLSDARARAVLERAAEASGWPGDGLGIAFARYKNAQTYAAVAVRLEVDDATAEIQLLEAWIAADAGQVVDPAGLENQLEGGVVQAASWTLKEAVTFDEFAVTSIDWLTYPILRFSEVPVIETHLLDRPDEPSLGAGEATQGPTAAAIANAAYSASGIRLRAIPFTPQRVREAAAR